MVGAGYYIGGAWYVRGNRILNGVEAAHLFLCQETEPPYLCSLVGMDPHALALGGSKCIVGLKEWQACVKNNRFPGYPSRAVYPEIPSWVDTAWEDQQVSKPIAYGSQG